MVGLEKDKKYHGFLDFQFENFIFLLLPNMLQACEWQRHFNFSDVA